MKRPDDVRRSCGNRVEVILKHRIRILCLEDLDTLWKNGRLTGIKSLVAGALNIKPVMGATPQGSNLSEGKARGMKRTGEDGRTAWRQMSRIQETKILAIAHCNRAGEGIDIEQQLLQKMVCSEVQLYCGYGGNQYGLRQ